MDNIIHVTSEKLISAASIFETTAGQVKTMTSNMTSTVQQLTGRVWSGDAASAYTTRFNGLQADINKLYLMITKHCDHLNTIAKKYESTESENITEANTLNSDVII